MIRVGQQGFTVIELILFLAVSGTLMTGLLFGVNANISQQRYQDSARSLQGLLQQQYFEVQNTTNERDTAWRCEETGIEAVDPASGQARGTTDCLLLGRYVRVHDGGAKLAVGSVVGYEPSESPVGGDLATLAAYKPRLSPVGGDTVDVDWQSRLVMPDDAASTAAIVLLRSPSSGVTRTFITEGELPVDLVSVLTSEAATRSIVQCIRTDSMLLGPAWSIAVQAGVAGPTGVTLNENDEAC